MSYKLNGPITIHGDVVYVKPALGVNLNDTVRELREAKAKHDPVDFDGKMGVPVLVEEDIKIHRSKQIGSQTEDVFRDVTGIKVRVVWV